MTRPIFEPSTQREIRRLGFSADQLFRRPRANPEGSECGDRCRLGISADFTIAAGTREIIEWDIVANPNPDTFDVVEAPPGTTSLTTAIQALVNGIYACTWATYIDTATDVDSGMMVDLSYATWTQESVQWFFPVNEYDDYPTPSYMPGQTWVFPSGPDYLPIFLAASTKFGSTGDLILRGNDLNITFMEMIFLCANNEVGDPYDFVTES